MTSKRIIPLLLSISLILIALLSALPAATRMDGNAIHTNTVVRKVEDLPGKGMTMRKVEKEYGKPLNILEAKGKPPITRWVYKEFTVYFEGPYVIHAVINHKVGPLEDEEVEDNSTDMKPSSSKPAE